MILRSESLLNMPWNSCSVIQINKRSKLMIVKLVFFFKAASPAAPREHRTLHLLISHWLAKKNKKIPQLNCVSLKKGPSPPNTTDPCECSESGRGRRLFSQRFTIQPFFTPWASLKIPKEPKRKYLTAVPSAAEPFLWYSSYTHRGPCASEPNSPRLFDSSLPISWSLSCFKRHFNPIRLLFNLDFRNPLKTAEGQYGKGWGETHKETGGWMYHVCHRECQCHDLGGEGKKISLWSAYLLLHLQ